MAFFQNFFSKSLSSTLTITSSNGFHLRPVAQFVSKAKKFDADIKATFNSKTVSAKAVNTLLSLNLDKEDTFTLTTKGKDAQIALNELENLFISLMKNDIEIKEIKKEEHHYQGTNFTGAVIVSGLAIAKLYRYVEKEFYTDNHKTFKHAIEQSLFTLETQTTLQNQDVSSISLAQRELLLQLSSHSNTLEDLTTLIQKEIASLKGGILESKAADYRDILRLVKSHLGFKHEVTLPNHPFILLANDLLPSDIAKLKTSAVQGVILKKTSLTSHTAILLRSAGITSMIITHDIDMQKHDVILDTYAGVLIIEPNSQDINQAKIIQTTQKKISQIAYNNRLSPATTKDDKHIHIYANVTDVHSAKVAKEEGAEGIGLLRTEFLFAEKKPSIKEQTKAYTEIFDLFEDVTVRTLDVGGDKALPYIDIPHENNPFLGIRGIRLFQSHPQILEEQLHAIFVAAQGKNIKVMFPMVSSVEEFKQAKAVAQSIADKHHLDISNISFGIMIEVPSVLFLIDDFNKVVDFYSIGTNDLTQYLFAIERTHPTLKTDALSPVVFTVLENIVNTITKPISICGEIASNAEATKQLIRMGYKTLSITPKNIPHIKETIRNV